MVVDPIGVDLDPDPILKKTPDPTVKKENRIQIRKHVLYSKSIKIKRQVVFNTDPGSCNLFQINWLFLLKTLQL